MAFLFLISAVSLAITMAVSWSIALRYSKSGWIDCFWTFGIGAFELVAALAQPAHASIGFRQGLVAVLVAVWSSRLGNHIARRTARGGDDPRYQQLRIEWGERFAARLFWLVQLQALVALILVIVLYIAAHNPASSNLSDGIGVVLFIVAIAGETFADTQLARFAADPANKGKICDAGLWGHSRHPNYLFEWLVWLAYVPIAIDWTGYYSLGWLVLLAPTLMYWLLVRVSGIPPLEAHMLRSRGDAFRAYQAKVSAFWPSLVRNNPSTIAKGTNSR